MNKIIFYSITICLVLSSPCSGQAAEVSGIQYQASVYKKIGNDPSSHIYIEKVVLQESKIISRAAAKLINSNLSNVYLSLYKDAIRCHDPKSNTPGGYEVKFEKIVSNGESLSIIFSIFSVCANSPYIDKIAKSFSLRTGEGISPDRLVQNYAPSVLENRFPKIDQNSVKLNEDAVDDLMDENSDYLDKKLRETCEFFLKKTSYAAWIDGNRLILFPSFLQPESICQHEYHINIKNEKQPN